LSGGLVFVNTTPPPTNANTQPAKKNATLQLMRDERYRHPFYWAGFVLVGRSD
jgi:CHAT domain-containing protein